LAKSFSNWGQLEKYLNEVISFTLQDEVANEVVEVMTEDDGVIDKEVYDKYTPYNLAGTNYHYHRTYKLKDKSNFEKLMLDKNTLSIRSTRNEDGRDITSVIEYGKGYTWGKASGYTRDLDKEIGARPFHEKTKEELLRSGRHIESLKKGLVKRGLEVL